MNCGVQTSGTCGKGGEEGKGAGVVEGGAGRCKKEGQEGAERRGRINNLLLIRPSLRSQKNKIIIKNLKHLRVYI